MSLYTIAKLVFFVAIGLLFVFTLGRTTEVIAGIAALVCAILIVVGETNTRR